MQFHALANGSEYCLHLRLWPASSARTRRNKNIPSDSFLSRAVSVYARGAYRLPKRMRASVYLSCFFFLCSFSLILSLIPAKTDRSAAASRRSKHPWRCQRSRQMGVYSNAVAVRVLLAVCVSVCVGAQRRTFACPSLAVVHRSVVLPLNAR